MPTTSTPSCRGESGDRAEQRQAMVAVGVDLPAAQTARATDDEAVLGRLDLAAQAAQAVDHRGDPIRFLDPQLARPPDHGLAFGKAAQQRHQRQLVDGQRHLVGLDGSRLDRRAADIEVGHRLLRAEGADRLQLAEDDRAHPLEDAQEARPRPVDAHVLRAPDGSARPGPRR